MRDLRGHTKYRRLWKVGAWLHARGFHRLASRIEALIRVRWSADLPSGAGLSDNVVLMHNALGVVLHQETVFLGRAVIFQNVTIGESGRVGERNQVPSIGDRVFIGSGSVLLGPISIGDGSIIAAGTVVTRSVPAGHIAYGVPMRVKPATGSGVLEDWF